MLGEQNFKLRGRLREQLCCHHKTQKTRMNRKITKQSSPIQTVRGSVMSCSTDEQVALCVTPFSLHNLASSDENGSNWTVDDKPFLVIYWGTRMTNNKMKWGQTACGGEPRGGGGGGEGGEGGGEGERETAASGGRTVELAEGFFSSDRFAFEFLIFFLSWVSTLSHAKLRVYLAATDLVSTFPTKIWLSRTLCINILQPHQRSEDATLMRDDRPLNDYSTNITPEHQQSTVTAEDWQVTRGASVTYIFHYEPRLQQEKR
ncbi:hypothetical protein FQA47_006294 [Oryzias melastigma]|uniref:Uncharacterized protein n=1 Tax=Oryzias melastigma TaxID=30732 RepID=A0A834FQW7_ORYME|nr:hypothetical protein FQA47_006294 [Oryzias melastigma]